MCGDCQQNMGGIRNPVARSTKMPCVGEQHDGSRPGIASLLYRAAQELLSNVYKFAQASEVTVRLGCVTGGMSHGVQLKVTDDGRGFDVPATMIARHTGMGLRLMQLAVVLAGGEMIVDSSTDAGTCVTITLPLD
jgi:two-component system, NarL family, sensor histidine kinase UhpB